MHVMVFILPPVTYVCHTVKLRNTNFGVYQATETAASSPRAWHVNKVIRDMHVMGFMLPPVIYVCHTVTSRNTNLGVYQASETAASSP